MTSRRKAKRADWIEHKEGWFVRDDDGTLRQFSWPQKWYIKKKGEPWDQANYFYHHVDPMRGCVKKSIQQRHRGSWNLNPLDSWYNLGLISWNRTESRPWKHD